MSGIAAILPGSTRANTPTWIKPTSSCCNTARRCENPPLLIVSRHRAASSSTPTSPTPVKRVTPSPSMTCSPPAGLDLLRRSLTTRTLPPRPDLRGGHPQGRREVRPPGRSACASTAHAPQVAHFLIRLLFCLFAEDIDLLPDHIFTRLVHSFAQPPAILYRPAWASYSPPCPPAAGSAWRPSPTSTAACLTTPPCWNWTAEGLYDPAGGLRPSIGPAIEPSIFGTLFERSPRPRQALPVGRALHQQGRYPADHRAGADGPPAPRMGAGAGSRLEPLADQRGCRHRPARPPEAGRRSAEALQLFADHLARVRVLDPACGSGNFLYVALRQLLDLQKEVRQLASRAGSTRPFIPPSPRPSCTASRSTSTPTSWPRPPSRSATSSG